jgi:hypothetical protein
LQPTSAATALHVSFLFFVKGLQPAARCWQAAKTQPFNGSKLLAATIDASIPC